MRRRIKQGEVREKVTGGEGCLPGSDIWAELKEVKGAAPAEAGKGELAQLRVREVSVTEGRGLGDEV